LNAALAEESETRGLTRAGIAEILGKDKAAITRKFSGTSNMTLETLADLAYALDRSINIELISRSPMPGSNVDLSNILASSAYSRTSSPIVMTGVNSVGLVETSSGIGAVKSPLETDSKSSIFATMAS
jgi:transcriptional regulator with XRE-family HTH domain